MNQFFWYKLEDYFKEDVHKKEQAFSQCPESILQQGIILDIHVLLTTIFPITIFLTQIFNAKEISLKKWSVEYI